VLEVTASVNTENGATASLVIEKEKGLLSAGEVMAKAEEARLWEERSKLHKIN
jgi:hypothetical protein